MKCIVKPKKRIVYVGKSYSVKPTYQYQERQLVKLVRVIECKKRASCIHMSVKSGGKNIENGEWVNGDIGVLSTGR